MSPDTRPFGLKPLLAAARAVLLPAIVLAASAPGQTPASTAASAPTAAVDARPSGPTFIVSDLPSARPLRIVVYGDMRFTNPSNTSDTSPGVRKWLAEKVAEEKPDLMLLTGDMPFHGGNPDDWKIYDQETAAWRAERLRVYPTIGNHEVLPTRDLGLANYFRAYPQIGNSPWYSVRLGNIYLITLDSSSFLAPGWPQREWLEAQLKQLPPDVDFVFLLFHVPMIADLQTAFMLGIPGPGGLEVRQYIEAQAAKSHAKFVVFNGHIHNYERFELNGITHVITGGGGAKPYPVFLRGDQDLFRAHTYPNFNYVLITLKGKHADAKMYRVADPYSSEMHTELKDSFTLDAR